MKVEFYDMKDGTFMCVWVIVNFKSVDNYHNLNSKNAKNSLGAQ